MTNWQIKNVGMEFVNIQTEEFNLNLINKTNKKADMAIFGEKFRTIKCNCWSIEERILEMKEHEIDIYNQIKYII